MANLDTHDIPASKPRRRRGSTAAFHYYVRLLCITDFSPTLFKDLVAGDNAIELKRAAVLWSKAMRGDRRATDRVLEITDDLSSEELPN